MGPNNLVVKFGVLTFLVLQDIPVFLVDHNAAKTIVRPETHQGKRNDKGAKYVITICKSLKF
jgi:hypothetical protein